LRRVIEKEVTQISVFACFINYTAAQEMDCQAMVETRMTWADDSSAGMGTAPYSLV